MKMAHCSGVETADCPAPKVIPDRKAQPPARRPPRPALLRYVGLRAAGLGSVKGVILGREKGVVLGCDLTVMETCG
jgi:hypothetical protein